MLEKHLRKPGIFTCKAAPSQAELPEIIKEKLRSQMKYAVVEKYGNPPTIEEIQKELASFRTNRERRKMKGNSSMLDGAIR